MDIGGQGERRHGKLKHRRLGVEKSVHISWYFELETWTVWVDLEFNTCFNQLHVWAFQKEFPHSDGLGVSGSPFHFLLHHHLPLAVVGEEQKIASLYRSQLNSSDFGLAHCSSLGCFPT